MANRKVHQQVGAVSVRKHSLEDLVKETAVVVIGSVTGMLTGTNEMCLLGR